MKTNTCCFTGHRILSKNQIHIIKTQLTEEIKKLIMQGTTHFMTGGAIGFDTIAAQKILDLRNDYKKISLTLVIPCEDQASKWSDKDKYIYEDIKMRADKVIYTSKKYEKNCMLKRNQFMVDNSNFIISAWDGRKIGGTYYTVNYAKKLGKKIIFIDMGSKNYDIY